LSAQATPAGYSAKTAFIIGHGILRKPSIAAAVQERQAALALKLGLSAERVPTELSQIVLADSAALQWAG
jgi:phage terminase small subunit